MLCPFAPVGMLMQGVGEDEARKRNKYDCLDSENVKPALPQAAAWQLRARPHILYNKPYLLKPSFRDLSSTVIHTVLESTAVKRFLYKCELPPEMQLVLLLPFPSWPWLHVPVPSHVWLSSSVGGDSRKNRNHFQKQPGAGPKAHTQVTVGDIKVCVRDMSYGKK
ncbi:hypothetical protein DUI87_06907 [Hirundo rustica rustica]|uniref:Uncharacterized protein n=1 Tax=Hirundo rustica rustica TaxID=333673 RepID=A0A3M0KNV0_HIRRU|nr:hypothetical protein DUI87_06907 [Hirundo rustica rustica]